MVFQPEPLNLISLHNPSQSFYENLCHTHGWPQQKSCDKNKNWYFDFQLDPYDYERIGFVLRKMLMLNPLPDTQMVSLLVTEWNTF